MYHCLVCFITQMGYRRPPETGCRGPGSFKRKDTVCDIFLANEWRDTCLVFVIYPFLTFVGSFRGEKETWVRNRKSLHTARDDATSFWAVPLLTPDIQSRHHKTYKYYIWTSISSWKVAIELSIEKCQVSKVWIAFLFSVIYSLIRYFII